MADLAVIELVKRNLLVMFRRPRAKSHCFINFIATFRTIRHPISSSSMFYDSEYLKQFIPLKEKHICAYIIHTRMGRESLTNDSGTQALTEKKKESLVTAVYLGAIFIILALVFVLNTGIWVHITNFFNSLTLAPLPGTSISLPAPAAPAAHTTLYAVAFQFTIGIGILEIVILVLEFCFIHLFKEKPKLLKTLFSGLEQVI